MNLNLNLKEKLEFIMIIDPKKTGFVVLADFLKKFNTPVLIYNFITFLKFNQYFNNVINEMLIIIVFKKYFP